MEAILLALIKLFAVANTLTPYAIIALVTGVLYVVLWRQPNKKEFQTLTDNHLSELPVIAAHTASIAESIRRIENAQTKAFAEINTKLDILS
jgi:hypothetical protein